MPKRIPSSRPCSTELDRSMTRSSTPGFEKPFFIEYRIEDVTGFETRAEFGATGFCNTATSAHRSHHVRVGDYKTDNSGPRGDGALQLTALDDDPIALRSASGRHRSGLQELRFPPTRKNRRSSSRCRRRRRPTTSASRSRSSRLPTRCKLEVDEACVDRSRRARQRHLPHRSRRQGRATATMQYSTRQLSRPRHHHVARQQRRRHRPQIGEQLLRNPSAWARRPPTACGSTAPMAPAGVYAQGPRHPRGVREARRHADCLAQRTPQSAGG